MKNIWIPMIFVAVMIAVLTMAKRKPLRSGHFDEMQLLIRANGYKLGYYATLLALAVVFFLSETGALEGFVSPMFAVFAAVMLGITLFAVYCIRHEAFFSVGDKCGYYIGLCVLIVLADGFMAVSRLMDGSILDNGIVTFDSGNSAVMTLTFLAVLTALLVKRAQRNSEAEE